MRKIECDRCHAEIQAARDVVGVVSLTTASLKGVPIKYNPFKGWDLCNDCYEEIRKFIETDPNAEEPKRSGAKIKRPISDGTKYAAVTPEKIEQIKQMARDGKTVKEICDATGVSDPTVRKYKKGVTHEEPDTEGDAED